MLETVKAKISEVKSEYPSFDTYYMEYICSVQDKNIEYEARYLRYMNKLNPFSMQSIIEYTYEELKKFDFNQ